MAETRDAKVIPIRACDMCGEPKRDVVIRLSGDYLCEDCHELACDEELYEVYEDEEFD